MRGSVECRFVQNIHTYFTKKDVTHILSVFRWDVSHGEVLGIIQFHVLPRMGCFIIGVLVNFVENLTHWLCRRFNTYDCLMRVKLRLRLE